MNVAHDYPRRIPAAVAPGQVLVHNRVQPARRQGTRGFRFWLQPASDTLTRCECGWAPELPEHYRVLSVRPFGGWPADAPAI